MPHAERLKNKILPIKPLASGKNRDKRPSVLFSSDQLGSEEEEDPNEDQASQMDKLLSTASQGRETGRSSYAIKTPQAPSYTAPVYQAPVYPGPPGSLPVPSYSGPTSLGQSASISAPTFEYKSVYTNESLQFQAKQYESIPGQVPASTGIPTPSYPIMGSSAVNYPAPNLPTLEKKTYTMPPSSTKNMVTPESPFTKGTLPQTTTASSKTMEFKDSDSTATGELDAKNARKQKLQEALRLKAQLQAEKERNDQQKISGLTPEQLEEKRRADQEKLEQDLANKALNKLEEEATSLKQQLDQVQQEIQQFQAKSQKLTELQARFQQTQSEVVQKKEQAAKDQQNVDFELTMLQSELQNLKTKTQSLTEQNSTVKSDRDENNKQLYVLNEQKTNLTLTIGEDSSLLRQLNEQLDGLAKGKEDAEAEMKITASQLEEIRTTGVILDPFLQAKIEEAKKKQQVAQTDLNTNESKLNDLNQKLDAANQKEIDQKQESEQMYKDVEVMCQAKENMDEQIKQFSEDKKKLQSSHAQLEQRNMELHNTLSSRQKYLYDVQSTLDRSQQELSCQQKIRDILHQIAWLNLYQCEDEKSLRESETNFQNDFKSVSAVIAQTQSDIELQVQATKTHQDINQELAQQIESAEHDVEQSRKRVIDISADQDANQNQHSSLIEVAKTEKPESEAEENQLLSVMLERVTLLESVINDTQTQTNECEGQLQSETKQVNLNESQELELQNENKQWLEKLQVSQTTMQSLTEKKVQDEVLIERMGQYIKACEESLENGRQSLMLLKNDRLAEISEAITVKIQLEKKEAELDQEHTQVSSEIDVTQDEISKYQQAKSQLELTQTGHDTQLAAHKEWLISTTQDIEQVKQLRVELEQDHQDSQQTISQEDEQMKQLTQSVSETKIQCEEHAIEIQNYQSAISQAKESEQLLEQTFDQQKALLKQEQEDLQTEIGQRDHILATIVETDPEHQRKVDQLSEQIAKADSQSSQLAEQHSILVGEFETTTSRVMSSTAEFDELQAKLAELTQEQTLIAEQNQGQQQIQSNSSQKQEQLQTQFTSSESKLKNLEFYLKELEALFNRSTSEWNQLKAERIAEIEAAIRDKLDSQEREKQTDNELEQLRLEIETIQADIQLYESASSQLSAAKEKINQHDEDYKGWQQVSDLEHQSHWQELQDVQATQTETSQNMQSLAAIYEDLQTASQQFQLNLQEVDSLISQLNQGELDHVDTFADLTQVLQTSQESLSTERTGFSQHEHEFEIHKSNTPLLDLDFEAKLKEINQQLVQQTEYQAKLDLELGTIEEQAQAAETSKTAAQSQLEQENQTQSALSLEVEQLGEQIQSHQSNFDNLHQQKQTLDEKLIQAQTTQTSLSNYIQECVQHQEVSQEQLKQLRTERLQQVEQSMREKLDEEKQQQILESQIASLQEEMAAIQQEIDLFNIATSRHSETVTKTEDAQRLITAEQTEKDNEHGEVLNEGVSLAQDLEQLKLLLKEEDEKQIAKSSELTQMKDSQENVQLEILRIEELLQSEGAALKLETDKKESTQSTYDQEKKDLNDTETQLLEVMADRVKVLEQQTSDLNLDKSKEELDVAQKEHQSLQEEASILQNSDHQSKNQQLLERRNVQNENAISSQRILDNHLKYEQELIDMTIAAETILAQEKQNRLEQIKSLLDEERLRQEEIDKSSREASAVQPPVNNKRRHVRNQSLIGNDLANSTFDSSQQSNISGAELEQKVKEALDKDSQGSKVTFYDMKEEQKDVIEEEPNDDEFFSDQMIERKRSSERGRRSSSSDKEPNEGEPQSQFAKDNQLRKRKWANPTLRHIDECSEEQLVSEYGSEVGGHEFGRTGSGIFGLSTTQRLINKSNKLNQFGVVGPQQEQQTVSNNHTRNESAGSVQVPLSEEHIEEQSINLMPTVPVPTIVPVARPSETRPSIFDMQRKSSAQGSYRATTYDKLAPTKRIANALKQKLGSNFESSHTEENVLGDLLVCLLAQKQMLSIQSDFEMNQGFALFEQMLKDDPKCHEGMFGLGRINYIQGRYEIAEKWLMKAYEVKRDFAYRVWLGFAQMQLYRVCTAENPKKLKFVQNAIANLDRCAKEVKVGVYASFGLLYLSLQLQTIGVQVKGLQEPNYYEAQIRGYSTQVDLYEGELASAIIKLATNQATAGVKQLTDLLVKDRPHAYYVLIHYYLSTNDLVRARQTADDGFNKLTGYENFQERLMITLLLCKCYYKTGHHAKLLVTLQNQLLESPHFSSLLYVYGKYIIQSFKLADYLQSAIAAMQECMRVSCQVRRAKCAYWLSLAYQATGQMTQCGLNQYIYVNEIKQVVKSGSVQVRGVKSRVNVNVQKQIKEKLSHFYQPIEKYSSDVLFTKPQQCLKGQMSDPEWPEDADLTSACQRIPQQRDQLLYKSITLYKIKKDFQQADQLFLTLSREHPEDFEIQSENASFLRSAILNQYKPQRPETPRQEALKLLEMLDSCEIQGDQWANAHMQCAKLLSVIAYQSDDFNLQIKAFECLLKIKNTLPVIDTKIAGVKLPGTVSRYLFEEFDHVDFQASALVEEEEKEGQSEFKPQDDYDQSNKFFSQSQYFQSKLKACPLATLSVAEIKDQVRIKGDTLFFFGHAQTELAYQAEEVSKEIQENNISEPTTAKIYYRSSTPLICVIKYLQHIRRINNSTQEAIPAILPEAVSDIGFSIYSDPDWLYQIAKMCLKWNVFIDLAVHCVQLYLQVVNYYRHFYPIELLDTKGQLLLAKILVKCSTNLSEDRPVAESIVKALSARIAETINIAKSANNERAVASALKNQENLNQLKLLIQ